MPLPFLAPYTEALAIHSQAYIEYVAHGISHVSLTHAAVVYLSCVNLIYRHKFITCLLIIIISK